MIESFHFLRPLWLIAIPLVAALWWVVRGHLDPLRGWRKAVAPELLKPMIDGQDTRTRWRGIPLLAGWVLAALALAGPTWKPEPSPFADDPVPVMLVLSAAESMALNDMPPSRMERARLKIADLAEKRAGQPLGLVCYAGSAHLVLPPTRDTLVVANMAAEVSPDIMPKAGGDLAQALQLAERTLGEAGGSAIVIADTVAPDAMGALAEFRKASRLPVHLFAVARGDTPEWDALNQAAKVLSASITPIAPDSSDVDVLVRKSSRAPVAVAGAGAGTRWAESGWWLILPVALLVLAGFRRETSAEVTT